MIKDEVSSASANGTYSIVAISLHWLIAALLIFEVGLGLRMEGAKGASQFEIFQLHKSVGITILLLVGLRLIWRFYAKPPPLTASKWERVLASLVHRLFYVLLIVLPISGWIIISTSRIAVPTFLYGQIPWPHLPGLAAMAAPAREAWNSAAEFVHVNLVYGLYALVALHLAGALKHHFLDRDGTLARMAPGAKPGAWGDPRLIMIAVGFMIAAGLALQWARVGPAEVAASRLEEAPPAIPDAAPVPPPADLAATSAKAPDAPQAAEGNSVADNAEVKPAELSSWTISKGSTIRFRTNWSGDVIQGGFNRFEGSIVFSPDHLDRSRVEIRIDTSSVFSGDAQRDDTLKSADWFSAAAYETAIFKADRFRKTGADRYVASGSLSLKGVTLPISLSFTLGIEGDKATARGNATVDRTAYKIGEGEFASTSQIPAAVQVDVVVHASRTK